MRRRAACMLLALYVLISLLACGLPHDADCASGALGHCGHRSDSAAHVETSHAGDHDSDCATCKFLGLRHFAGPSTPDPLVAAAVWPLTIASPASYPAQPRFSHAPRGPPAI